MVNARQSAKMERQSQERARAYLRLIMQVQAGEMTVSGAARQLGVSRQVFHEHCNRMLAASLEALDGGRGGRPAQSAEQLQIREMEQQLAEKTKELSNLKILYDLRGEVLTLFRDGSSPARTGKKKNESRAGTRSGACGSHHGAGTADQGQSVRNPPGRPPPVRPEFAQPVLPAGGPPGAGAAAALPPGPEAGHPAPGPGDHG